MLDGSHRRLILHKQRVDVWEETRRFSGVLQGGKPFGGFVRRFWTLRQLQETVDGQRELHGLKHNFLFEDPERRCGAASLTDVVSRSPQQNFSSSGRKRRTDPNRGKTVPGVRSSSFIGPRHRTVELKADRPTSKARLRPDSTCEEADGQPHQNHADAAEAAVPHVGQRVEPLQGARLPGNTHG